MPAGAMGTDAGMDASPGDDDRRSALMREPREGLRQRVRALEAFVADVTRVALEAYEAVVNSSQGGEGKATWVVRACGRG